jgi:ribosomal protein S18 acetylase RimI-like enzyme
VGVLAMDIDKEIGRAWLYGPVVGDVGSGEKVQRTSESASHREWEETADALYAAIAPRLPAGIDEQEMFVDAANVRCRAFADRHGFRSVGEWAIYTLTPDRLAGLPAAEAEPWDERYAAQFEALHSRLFPRSSYTMSYIRKEHAENGAALLILTDGDALRGYFFGRVEADTGEAYVDLIGVDEASRGLGLGRRLMLAGLSRLREMPGLRQVNLSVAVGNAPAIALYDALGFVRERDMIALRKAR